ncbi:hypothetical protein AGMMS49975_12720 [Clostridia bacterium]|nr:hypothetical protein AGMMS49975_12720 [Clostridia bacterium]
METPEYIYIVLVKALTGLGNFVRKLTKYDYTHIAVSFDDTLTEFVSFSRRKHYEPLNSGIMREFRSCYAYGDNEKFRAKVFALPVEKDKMTKIKAMVNEIENDKEYMFNLFSMVTMPVLHGFTIYKTHNCMTFVSLIVKETDAVKMPKPYYKYSIPDLDTLLSDYLFFEGDLQKDGKNAEDYMTKPRFIHNVKTGCASVLKLFGRLSKRGDWIGK